MVERDIEAVQVISSNLMSSIFVIVYFTVYSK